jgi:hypothetical protein
MTVICSPCVTQKAAALCSELHHWENGCNYIHCSREKGDEV